MSATSHPGLSLPTGSRILAAMRAQSAAVDARSFEACERYESRLVAEARAIARGATSPAPTAEHVRVLLAVIERLEPHASANSPF